MPFVSQTFQQLQQQVAQDFSNNQLQLLPKSVLQIIGREQAALAYMHTESLYYISIQCVPWTCTGEYIDHWANLKGVYRKSPTQASGAVSFTGVANSVVPQGEVLSRQDGVTYTTDAQFTIGTTTTVNAVATILGSSGNAPLVGTSLTLANVVLGVNSNVALSTAIIGGSDLETDSIFRTRMLAVYASPPSGGNSNDFIQWAEAVPGVTRAWCLPNGAGAGTVIVYTMWDDDNATSNPATSGFPIGTNGTASLETRGTGPATGNQLTVANYIYPLRPATALVYSFAPLPYSINISLTGLSGIATSTQAAITAALTALYLSIGTPLGTASVAPSQIYGAIDSVVPTTAFTIISPSASVAIPAGYLPVVGTTTYL